MKCNSFEPFLLMVFFQFAFLFGEPLAYTLSLHLFACNISTKSRFPCLVYPFIADGQFDVDLPVLLLALVHSACVSPPLFPSHPSAVSCSTLLLCHTKNTCPIYHIYHHCATSKSHPHSGVLYERNEWFLVKDEELQSQKGDLTERSKKSSNVD